MFPDNLARLVRSVDALVPGNVDRISPMTTGRFRKSRTPAPPGSIPERLQMFAREVRFYQDVSPDIDVRTPHCYVAELHSDGSTYLELEDLSDWTGDPPPASVGQLLRRLHQRWQGEALGRWPWLPRPDASDLVEELYSKQWPRIEARRDIDSSVRDLGRRLVGRVGEAMRGAENSGARTLVHGDASAANMRVDQHGQIALLDWEDFDWAPGTVDLAWHLMSSQHPKMWDEAVAAYGSDRGLRQTLPATCVQAFLCLAGEDEGSNDAQKWAASLLEARVRMS